MKDIDCRLLQVFHDVNLTMTAFTMDYVVKIPMDMGDIPMDCTKQGASSYYRHRQRYRYELPCGVMDPSYAKKYELPSPQCHQV
uniref:Alpha-1,6-mannosyl-glycoprotein 6-beta-N-acetylglucosaminyltransferase n=1 Tax=Angiostrongylus cantonensis TaxID=6313 RepID=A0A0K0DCW9_ANGCA